MSGSSPLRATTTKHPSSTARCRSGWSTTKTLGRRLASARSPACSAAMTPAPSVGRLGCSSRGQLLAAGDDDLAEGEDAQGGEELGGDAVPQREVHLGLRAGRHGLGGARDGPVEHERGEAEGDAEEDRQRRGPQQHAFAGAPPAVQRRRRSRGRRRTLRRGSSGAVGEGEHARARARDHRRPADPRRPGAHRAAR